jgi:hypothetical protein
VPVAELTGKPVQDRFVSSAVQAAETSPQPTPSAKTKTAEAMAPTGGIVAPAQ